MTSLPMVPNIANIGFRNDLIMMNNGASGSGGDGQFQGVFGGGLEGNLDV
ncbi:hypothetical protein Tco_0661650, partial [Tanacetum coccineum]